MTDLTGTTYEQLTGQLMLELEQGDAVETVGITVAETADLFNLDR